MVIYYGHFHYSLLYTEKKSGERSTTMAISVHFFKNILYSNKTDNASNSIQIAMTSSKRPQAIRADSKDVLRMSYFHLGCPEDIL